MPHFASVGWSYQTGLHSTCSDQHLKMLIFTVYPTCLGFQTRATKTQEN